MIEECEKSFFLVTGKQAKVRITAYQGGIVRITYPLADGTFARVPEIAEGAEELSRAECETCLENGGTSVCFEDRKIMTDEEGAVRFFIGDKEVLREFSRAVQPRRLYLAAQGHIEEKKTADGRKTFVKDVVKKFDRMSNKAEVCFSFGEGVFLYGLGSHPGGAVHFTDKRVRLYQHNLKISLPVVVSSEGWAVLLNSRSDCVFDGRKTQFSFRTSYVPALEYFVVLGTSPDGAVRGIRTLTGGVSMLPKRAYGYMQSREHYMSQEEIGKTARRFRDEKIPLDCIVQDWQYWSEGHWGEKKFDPARYPDPPRMVAELHESNVRFMVSVWPCFSPQTQEYSQFKSERLLLCDDSTYNAFEPRARDLYFAQLKENILSCGTDALWCDSSEPVVADWLFVPERPSFKKNIEAFYNNIDPEIVNVYALAHCKGIYEHQRAENASKRVFTLTRSASIGQSRYGSVVWAGDTSARWDVFEHSIAAALNYCATGEPYWTYDAGAFFVNTHEDCWFWKGQFPDRLQTNAYKEYYVRMLQAAVFLTLMRSHGTDCHREPWQFGKRGEPYYEAILSAIRLRYQMLPYIYSTAGAVCLDGDTMLRHLFFDFPEDERACRIGNQFMFGRELMVCPVTKAGQTKKRIYFPSGCDWYDFYTGQKFSGGRSAYVHTELSKIPLYVRAGAIFPVNDSAVQYSMQESKKALLVFGGADGSFNYYDDAGDGYGYEQGEYVRFRIRYVEKEKRLYFSENEGKLSVFEEFLVSHRESGVKKTVCYEGNALAVDLV